MTHAVLSRIDHWLSANRTDYYSRLQIGAADVDLDEIEKTFSIKLPAGFRELYKWRNGQDAMCNMSLVLNRMFMPLDDIKATKCMLDGMIDSDFDDPKYWRRGWVPFLHNGAGSHLCLDLDGDDGGQSGQLIAFWKSDSDRPIEYTSIDMWLVDLASSMESGSLELC